MKFFQKLFKRSKKEKKQENECWYNNAHEQKKPRWVAPMEGGAMASPNGVYYTESQKAENAQ